MDLIPFDRNRIAQYFPPRLSEPPGPPTPFGERILAGAESAGFSMILVDGRPAVGFELSGAVVMSDDLDPNDAESYGELYELLGILGRIGARKAGAK